MIPEEPNLANAYETLTNKIKGLNPRSCQLVFVYLWGRLSRFNKDLGRTSAASDDEGITVATDASEKGASRTKLLEAASRCRQNAISVDINLQYNLVTVAYWSTLSYYFEYCGSNDSDLLSFSIDSFLSSVEELGLDLFESRASISVEVDNIFRAVALAEISDSRQPLSKVHSWASDVPFGFRLPEYDDSGLY